MAEPHHGAGNDAEAGVRVEALSKSYGDVQALDGVSLSVDPRELFGVIGPDGAGKSTLFRILVTVIEPDSGTGTIDGLDLVADYRTIRKRVGYMPGRFALYPDLTVRENLEFFASVFGTTVETEYELIAPIYSQIEPFNRRRTSALSGGMKQKLALCCALVHRPRVLVLDEPTTGVDAVSRAEFWDMLAGLKSSGMTILVSTPYMDEAARCDRIALMQGGRLLREPDTPRAVAASFQGSLARVRAAGGRQEFLTQLRANPQVQRAEVFGEWVHVTGSGSADDSDELAASVAASLRDSGWKGVATEPAAPSVEDVFMALMSDAGRTEVPTHG